MMEVEIQYQLLQPWSTFVMKTKLPPSILEKMIRITDEIVENKETNTFEPDLGAGQLYGQFWIEYEALKQEEVMDYFLDVCRNYVIQAFCQSAPFDKENILKEEFMTQMTRIWINSQKDNEYFPTHIHSSAIAAVLYLKIPEYLPSRNVHEHFEEDGTIEFSNNTTQDQIWPAPYLRIQPQVGDFFIFPATQRHQVYPFRTADGKGERRSVSFNAAFTSKSEQDTLRKQQEDQEAI